MITKFATINMSNSTSPSMNAQHLKLQEEITQIHAMVEALANRIAELEKSSARQRISSLPRIERERLERMLEDEEEFKKREEMRENYPTL